MKRHFRKTSREASPFELIQVFVPKGTGAILREHSRNMSLPMSRLMAIALDNELDSPAPFNYPTPLPSSPFIPFAYVEEAQKIARFLLSFPEGTGRDSIMLCRRDIGVMNRETLMYGYRELLESGVIREIRPSKSKFKHAPDYCYAKLTSLIKEKKPND